MRTKVVWFLVGFVASWLTWAVVSAVRDRPRDYTQDWPESLRKIMAEEDVVQWLRHSNGLRVGNYGVFTPAKSSDASALVQSRNANGLPAITILDDNADGKLDSVLVVDSAYHQFSFVDGNADGLFDSCEYTTGVDPDSMTFRDDDMDGQKVRACSSTWLSQAWQADWQPTHCVAATYHGFS